MRYLHVLLCAGFFILVMAEKNVVACSQGQDTNTETLAAKQCAKTQDNTGSCALNAKSRYTPQVLERVREAEILVSSRSEVQENFAMVMQPHGNIEHMISPAPLSIALLGQLILLSLETDFSLEVKKTTNPPERLKYPGSLRASLLQVSHGGWDAFNLAHKNMDAIRLMAANVPTHVTNSVKIITGGTVEEMEIVLPKSLRNIQRIATDCTQKARDVEYEFVEVMSLISELLELCTAKRGEHEQEIKENKAARQAAEMARKQMEHEQKEAEKEREEMRKHFKQSTDDYKRALDSVPGAMTLLGMAIIDKATTVAMDTIQTFTDPSRSKYLAYINAGFRILKDMKGDDRHDQPETVKSNEPPQQEGKKPHRDLIHLSQLKSILDSLQQYVDTVQNRDSVKKGEDTLNFLRAQAKQLLSTMNIQIDMVAPKVKETIELIQKIAEHGRALAEDSDRAEALKNDTRDLARYISNLHFKLGVKIGSLPHPATPMISTAPVKSSTPNDVIKAVVEQSRLKFEQTSLVMKQAMEQYRASSERSQAANREMAKLVSDISMYELKEIDFETIRKTLLQGIEVLGKVREQWSQLVHYFQMMANIIENSLGESLQGFLEDAKSRQDLKTRSGSSLSAVMRDSIYLSASRANQIAHLVQGLSATYVEVSTKYIMPPLARLDTYMALDGETDRQKIQHLQRKLDVDYKAASQAVIDLVKDRHDEFLEKGYERIKKYEKTMRAALPPLTEEEEDKLEKMKEAAVQSIPVGEDGW